MTSLSFRSKFSQEKLSHWFSWALFVNLDPNTAMQVVAVAMALQAMDRAHTEN